jgi:Holliday junction resolvase RusA-like endonuclease
VSSRSADNVVTWLEGDPRHITFLVYGTPVPQGSKRAFRKGDKVVMVEQTKSKPWRQEIIDTILSFGLEGPLLGPVHCELAFYIKRPLHHYGTGRNAGVLKASAPEYVAVMPDADKLARAVLDALTLSNLLHDDGQIAVLTVSKRYGDRPGVRVNIRTLT